MRSSQRPRRWAIVWHTADPARTRNASMMELLDSLRELIPLAPLRLPYELSCIESVSSRYDELPQVVCFDNALFATLPEVTRQFPIPASLYEHPFQSRAFHGLSYESIVLFRGIGQAGLTILAHLGNGTSMIALRDGHPVDVHHESGLLGAPESSSDMRVILERRSRDERAALAFEMFCYQSKKAIGVLAAALGGVDNLVFTGGIGEQAPPVRERICASLRSIGIRLDATRNRREAPDIISADDSPCTIWVKGADEELVISRHTQRILVILGITCLRTPKFSLHSKNTSTF